MLPPYMEIQTGIALNDKFAHHTSKSTATAVLLLISLGVVGQAENIVNGYIVKIG